MAGDALAPLPPIDPREAATIQAVMRAADAAFNPRGDRKLTVLEVLNTCAALVTFLNDAERSIGRNWGFGDWREAIENLTVTLGPSHGR